MNERRPAGGEWIFSIVKWIMIHHDLQPFLEAGYLIVCWMKLRAFINLRLEIGVDHTMLLDCHFQVYIKLNELLQLKD